MPRMAMKDSEIEEIKKKILDTAVEIVHKDGFSNLSMRKIASRLKMTAANIYNYYANKDELNIEMRRYGFLILYDKITKGCADARTTEEKISQMVYQFVSFGIKYPNYYDLMFNMPTPKYMDYVGTPLEELAAREFNSSARIFEFSQKVAQEYIDGGGIVLINLNKTIIFIFSFLHGIITLYNSRMLKNIDIKGDPDKTMEELLSIIAEFVRNLKGNDLVKRLIQNLEKVSLRSEHQLHIKK